MQKEDLYTEGERIAYHLVEIRDGFPSRIGYHAEQLQRLLPKEEVDRVRNSRLDELAGLRERD